MEELFLFHIARTWGTTLRPRDRAGAPGSSFVGSSSGDTHVIHACIQLIGLSGKDPDAGID